MRLSSSARGGDEEEGDEIGDKENKASWCTERDSPNGASRGSLLVLVLTEEGVGTTNTEEDEEEAAEEDPDGSDTGASAQFDKDAVSGVEAAVLPRLAFSAACWASKWR